MRKPDLVACEQQRHRPGCAFMQFDPQRCYSLNTNVYNIQIGFIKKLQESPAQTAHPCNLIGATNNHFTTRVTNKIVPHRKHSFAFRVLVSLKMSFKVLMKRIYVVCRRVASCRHFTCDSLQHYSLYIWSILIIRSRHLVICRLRMIFPF